MRIFGWLADHSGCGWYRIVLPLDNLRERGHDTFWNIKINEVDLHESDVIIAQRTFKEGPTLRWQELAAKRRRPYKLVFELDDDLWSVDTRNAAGQVFSQPWVRNNLILNLQVADLVTVSTEPLADLVRRWNPNVVVLPNSIPSDMLSWRTGRHEDRFTVGWQGGPTHDRDWEAAAEPVARWFRGARKAGEPVEMHTVGAVPTHHPGCPVDCQRPHFPEVHPHRHTDWNSSIPHYYRSLDWHVALAPLAPSKFNHCKSNLRALEAAMLGFPVIASNVEAYGQFVKHGATGLLVDKPSEWGEYLSLLSNNQDARTEMGWNARQHVQQYTIEHTGHLWEKAYAAA